MLEVEDPGQRPLPLRESMLAGAFFAALVVTAALGYLDLSFAILLLVLGALVMGWLSEREIRRNFPFDLIILLWGSLVLGLLIDRSGMDKIAADVLMQAGGGGSVIASMLILFFVTWVLTEILSNSGAALVALPIALEMARSLGVPPEGFVMTVAFGASASFIIPFGYQTHVMVLTPGGYNLGHFIRLGSLVLLGYAAACLLVIWLQYFV
jgi:di/tricarboxylate transporter